MINVMPPGSATQEGALREFCVWRNCSGSVCEQFVQSDHFHGTDLAWNRSGMESIWVLLFRTFAGRIAKPFSSPEVRALLQREPVQVADRVVVASGIHDHLQRMCARG
jgi:hypothetical protein